MRGITVRRFLLFVVLSFGMVMEGGAQCTNQVTHMSGTMTVAGSSVTVVPSGQYTSYTTYCVNTQPYFVGYNFGTGSGFGSFEFTFSPPISSLTINTSGISNTPPNVEEIRLYVNGAHYAIPAPGVSNGCDPMGVLTAAGDIGGCAGCGVSGWSGTTISMPSISTFRVDDFIVGGIANGALFSLFICNVVLPVEWGTFVATPVEGKGVELVWETASESEGGEFGVERSWDGTTWEEISGVKGLGGVDKGAEYRVWDEGYVSGRAQYRIVHRDGDGAVHYSDVELIDVGALSWVEVYPNPVEDVLQVALGSAEDAVLVLRNPLGRVVEVPQVKVGDVVRLEVGELARGIYFLDVKSGVGGRTFKVVVE